MVPLAMVAIGALVACSLAIDTDHLRNGGPAADGRSDAGDAVAPFDADTDAAFDAAAEDDTAPTTDSPSPIIGAVFTLGGSEGTTTITHTPDVLRLEIHADGTVGHWTVEAPMPAAAAACASASSGRTLYVLGGDVSGLTTQSARFAPIVSGFRLGDWSTATKLPDDRIKLGAVATDSHVYAIGGQTGATGATVHADALVAASNPDGSLGAWTTTTSLPAPRFGLATLTVGGYVYAIAGAATPGGPGESTVFKSKIAADGSLSAWTTTAPLPAGLVGTSGAVIGTRLFVVGGYGGAHAVHYAQPDASGDVAAWTTASSTMTSPHAFFGLAATGSFLVSMAGFDDGSASTDVVEIATLSGGSLGAFRTIEKLPAARRFVGGFGVP